MANTLNRNPSSAVKEKQFRLPFSDETVGLSQNGAKQVARMACEMAETHSSPIESDKQYAIRLAAFICGSLADQCNDRGQRMHLFTDFLEDVYAWLNKGCSEYGGSHHWQVFHESYQGTGEIQKANQLDNI